MPVLPVLVLSMIGVMIILLMAIPFEEDWTNSDLDENSEDE